METKAGAWIQRLSKMGRQQWLILILLGLLLMAIAMPVSDKKENSQKSVWTAEKSEENLTAGGKTVLEQKLEMLLSDVEGVGKAEVVLMTKESSPDVFSSSEEVVTGALICAQGADDFTVVQNIKEAIMALFQLEAHKIKVMKMIKEISCEKDF